MRSTTAITTAIAAIACATSVHALGEPATEPMMLGGWSDKPVTDEHVKTLRTALSGGSKHYAARVGPTRVCFTDVARVETQVVSGTNYRFYIDGCAVPKPKLAGKCSTRSNKANSCASPTRYVIRVYEQTWTDTLQVESITQGDTEVLNADAPPPPAAAAALNADDSSDDSTAASTEELSTVATMSDAEKRAVDDWIAAEGRNAFGDTKDTYYLGGTPLFDESTGETIDKYVYIARRHPTRPWKQATPQATLRANMLAAAVESTTTADAAKRNNGGAQGLLSVIAGVGVLTMVLAVVAGVKAKRSTRRYAAYDQVARREI